MKGLWVLMITSFLYGQDAAYQAGLNASTSLDVARIDTGQVPGHASTHNENVEDYMNEKMQNRFSIHPDTDPLFINAERAVVDPDKTMENVVMEGSPASGSDELITCEQGGDEYIQKCEKQRQVVIEVIPEVGHTAPRSCPGHKRRKVRTYTNWCNPGCQGGNYVITQPKQINIVSDQWIDGCQTLELLADKGLCQCTYAEKGSKEARLINNEAIERSSWFEKYTYRCLKASANNCSKLGAKGCVQVASRCKERIGDVCVLYEQTYRCSKGKKKGSSYKATGNATPFCLTGDCANDQYDDNGELLEVLSQMSVLKEAQEDIRPGVTIFAGQVKACRKHAIGFSDCCTTGSNGWGQSWGLAGCNTEEKELADWRPQKRCVLVGTYCAEREKLTKICLRKKTSFCCFGNKLSRLIQEQGRSQLGIGWGDPKSPSCQGLTPEQLSRLDFSRMDLSDLFEDVARNFKPPSGEHMAKGVELDRIRANMNQMVKNIQVPKERRPA